MSFRQAVEGTPGLQFACRRGLQALEAGDKNKITCRHGRNVAGSVNIDAALKDKLPDASRWDYAIGMTIASTRDGIVWVEVHPASSSNVKEVLRKRDWLIEWLKHTARELERIERRIVWVASGAVTIRRGGPQHRRLAEQGLDFPRSHIMLEDVWGA